jgi:AraC-like DNA-binding protein/ligand-binding sensor domain-containing protein
VYCCNFKKTLLFLSLVLGVLGKMLANDFLFTPVNTSNGLSDNHIRYIMEMPDGRLVFTTQTHINLFDGVHFSHYARKPEHRYPLEAYSGFTHLYLQGDSLLWLKDHHQLSAFDLKKEQFVNDLEQYFVQQGLTEPVDDLFTDQQDRLWLVSGGQLLQEDLQFKLDLPPSPQHLQDLASDHEHLYLFFNTGEASCYQLNGGQRLYTRAAYPAAESSNFDNTSLIIPKGEGFYQLRNGSKGGFFHFDVPTRKWTRIMEKDYTLNTLMITGDNKAYITCVQGFWIIDLDSHEQQHLPALRTQRGKVLATEISTIYQDHQEALWLGTFSRGLLYHHPHRYHLLSLDKTDTSLSWKHPGPTTYFGEDRSGNIYLNDRGKNYQLNVDTSGKSQLLPISPTQVPKELQREYGSDAAFSASDGSLYFADKDGYSVYLSHPDLPTPALSHPPVFTAFYLQGEKILPNKSYHSRVVLPSHPPYVNHIELNHKQNFIILEFSALNYFDPKRTHYRYQLEGIDENWVYATHNQQSNGILQAHYTNLPPNEYRFKVAASVAPDRWDEKNTTSIQLVIHAPWWKTPWAYLIYTLLILLITYAALRLYVYQTKKRLERKNKEDLLLERIRSLIEATATEDNTKPDQNQPESPFIAQAVQLVEQNLHLPGYSVEQLSRDLCMDRTGLYRKLVTLLDQSPSLFIRNIRLQRAAQLLLQGQLSIAEVAEQTGFSSSSYLSKCFQERYGCRPSEYAKTKENAR